MITETKSAVTEPLRAEHRQLLPHLDGLAEAAAAVGALPEPELEAKVAAAHEFLAQHLIPHALAEDAVLYPQVDRLLGERGGTRATDTMRRDHLEVVRLTERLGDLRDRLHERPLEPAEEDELRRVLDGLHAVVALHFAKEEEVYLPLLDRELSAAEAEVLFEQMQHAAGGEGR